MNLIFIGVCEWFSGEKLFLIKSNVLMRRPSDGPLIEKTSLNVNLIVLRLERESQADRHTLRKFAVALIEEADRAIRRFTQLGINAERRKGAEMQKKHLTCSADFSLRVGPASSIPRRW